MTTQTDMRHVNGSGDRIAALEAQVMTLRAAVVARDSALAWAREDYETLLASLPGMGRRVALARQVDSLTQRVHALSHELGAAQRAASYAAAASSNRREGGEAKPEPAGPAFQAGPEADSGVDSEMDSKTALEVELKVELEAGLAAGLEASLVAADLVICQTGCLSHGDYWRVRDHCRRTGKACVLAAEPDALRIVRIGRIGAEASS